MSQNITCVILAAGQGTRMKSTMPKPLHKLAGRSMVSHVIAASEALSPDKIIIVTGKNMPEMITETAPHITVTQDIANGTGGAVIPAKSELDGFTGDVIVLFGDTPLITTKTLQMMIDKRREKPETGLVFAGMRPDDAGSYGRMVLNDDGTLDKIVEFKDADDKIRKLTLCNGGIMCADGAKLFDWLAKINNKNAQGEYYLTDLPEIAKLDNRTTAIVEVPATEMEGINSRSDLARLEKIMQQNLRQKHMKNGVTLTDPDTVFFAYDTKIGQDCIVAPNVIFGTGVTIENNVTIKAFSHIEGASVKSGSSIGPFARLRPDAHIGNDCKIGNFVEIKKTTLGKGSKASHLSYLGDATIGDNVNIGAGTITCNYDGFMKYKTIIHNDAFIGSNSSLIAPVTIGENAIIGAGSTITKDTTKDGLSVARAKQRSVDNWAKTFKENKLKEKNNL